MPTNTQFAIAVHVLTLLSQCPEEQQSSPQLATSVGSNPVHIRRVLGLLRRAELVVSRPGATGGWMLTRDPTDITLREVWEGVSGDARVLRVHDAAPDCTVGQSIQQELVAVERAVAGAIAEQLAGTTVADVLAAAAQPA